MKPKPRLVLPQVVRAMNENQSTKRHILCFFKNYLSKNEVGAVCVHNNAMWYLYNRYFLCFKQFFYVFYVLGEEVSNN